MHLDEFEGIIPDSMKLILLRRFWNKVEIIPPKFQEFTIFYIVNIQIRKLLLLTKQRYFLSVTRYEKYTKMFF